MLLSAGDVQERTTGEPEFVVDYIVAVVVVAVVSFEKHTNCDSTFYTVNNTPTWCARGSSCN